MGKWKKIIIGVSASLFILIVVIVLLSYLMLRKSLPEYDGTKSFAGLKSEVKILRDSHAVPMIIAENEEDAAFALGYVHAQERLFQMDVARRAGEGRLSEVFGSKTIAYDKMFRTIGIFKNVKENYSRLNPLSKKILDAYSKGVNKYIEEAKGKFPIEFDVLDYDPYPWKPEHSLVIAKLMGWELNISWWTDIAFASLVQKLGAEKAKELLPDFPQNAPTIIPKDLKSFASIPTDFINVDRDFRRFTGFVGTHIGSNNWVVNGNKSVSGKPIIANDPHLSFTAPGKWFFAIIKSKEWNAEGFTLPGMPAVVIGKNQNISWVMTNVMADDADFYIEKFDSSGNNYLLNNQWKQLSVQQDSFAVKNSGNYKFKIVRTHRGPVISNVHPYGVLYPEVKNSADISMRWTGLEFSDELFAALSINKAKNWNEFREALRYFTVPGQNFVYADAQGNIGYVCAARLPMRRSSSPTLVYDGTADQNDWVGFVPYDEMPKLFNPPQNFIASANNKTVENFGYHISNIWEPSSRIERITQLLNSKEKHSVKDFENYQNDFVSPYASQITRYILSAFNSVKINDSNLKLALELFENWDFKLDADSQVPTIYTEFLNQLLINTLEDELGGGLFSEYVFVANVPYRIIPKFFENNSSFFDDVRTSQTETRDDIIRKSLVDALNILENKMGRDIKNWQWKEVHKVIFKHMFSGAAGVLDKLINIGPFEIGGDGTTIFNTEYSFDRLIAKDSDLKNSSRSERYENILGPSMRFIFDFANPDSIEFVLPTGQSGNVMSDHYSDMTKMWLKGKYIKLPVSEDKFESSAKHKMVLLPK
jgi:penicillin amidase